MHQTYNCDVAVIQECLFEHIERAFLFELLEENLKVRVIVQIENILIL
jgi:hypothetical protein